MELDAQGRVITYEEYHPFGSTAFQSSASSSEVSPKRYRYTGKEKDEETALSYHGARYYVPWLGRWTSCDPEGQVDGLNLYQYAHSNPLRRNDTSGTDSGDKTDVVADRTKDSDRPADAPPKRSGRPGDSPVEAKQKTDGKADQKPEKQEGELAGGEAAKKDKKEAGPPLLSKIGFIAFGVAFLVVAALTGTFAFAAGIEILRNLALFSFAFLALKFAAMDLFKEEQEAKEKEKTGEQAQQAAEPKPGSSEGQPTAKDTKTQEKESKAAGPAPEPTEKSAAEGKKEEQADIDKGWFDRWSIVHTLFGVVAGLFLVPFATVVITTVAWELFEKYFPGFGDKEADRNRVSDIGVAWAGWLLFAVITAPALGVALPWGGLPAG
jgi:RHS repeat-associated protein